jgi:hypothetical protein
MKQGFYPMNSLKIMLPVALALFVVAPAIGGSAEACPRHYKPANSQADDARHARTVRMWHAMRYLSVTDPYRDPYRRP